jgi:hypothetical protein
MEVNGQFHASATLSLGDETSTHLIGGRTSPGARLDAAQGTKISFLCLQSNHDSPVVHLVGAKISRLLSIASWCIFDGFMGTHSYCGACTASNNQHTK